ncbi:MAG TPA: hypothetical protein VFV50_15330 [Bdellovibrionales bacterium]|nr:hypothetical protein [Bdellovibrionales bacterium]
MVSSINLNQFRLIFFLLAAQAVFLPAQIQKIDFRQLVDMKPVRVSLKRTSPPMSILEDSFAKAVSAPQTPAIYLRAGVKRPPQSQNQPQGQKPVQLAGVVVSRDAAQANNEEKALTNPVGRQMIETFRKQAAAIQPAAKAPAAASVTNHVRVPLALPSQATAQAPAVLAPAVYLGAPPVSAPKGQAVPPPQAATTVPNKTTLRLPTTPVKRPDHAWAKHFKQQISLSGPIEITGGLAFTGGGDYFTIYRQVGNTNLEAGRVWVRDGRFQITVAEPYGLLVAELRRSDGQLMGRGEVWIEDVEGALDGRPQEVHLVIEPSVVTTRGHLQTAYSYEGYSDPIPEADVELPAIDIETKSSVAGDFKMPETLSGSSFVVKANKKGYWGGLTLASNVSPYTLTMYPDRMIKALYELIGRPQGIKEGDFESSGIIWGKVTHREKPLAGTKVELADGNAFGPIYFNGLHLPDHRLESTGPNGLFVFIKANPGINVIRAYNGDKALPSKVVLVDHHHATHVALEASQKRVADVYVHDLLSKKPVQSEVRFVGSAKGGRTTAEGAIRLRYTYANDPLFIEVDSGDAYVDSRISTHRRARFIGVPQIPKDWMDSLVRKLPVTPQPGLGTIIGFVENNNFVAYLDRVENEYIQIFYFNQNGDIVPSGVAGGGFVIVNVVPGARTVTIGGDRTVFPWTQVTLVDSQLTSILTHKF